MPLPLTATAFTALILALVLNYQPTSAQSTATTTTNPTTTSPTAIATPTLSKPHNPHSPSYVDGTIAGLVVGGLVIIAIASCCLWKCVLKPRHLRKEGMRNPVDLDLDGTGALTEEETREQERREMLDREWLAERERERRGTGGGAGGDGGAGRP